MFHSVNFLSFRRSQKLVQILNQCSSVAGCAIRCKPKRVSSEFVDMVVTWPTLCVAAEAADSKFQRSCSQRARGRFVIHKRQVCSLQPAAVSGVAKKRNTAEKKRTHMQATRRIGIYHPAPPSCIMRLLTLGWKNEHLETSSAAVSWAVAAQGERTRATCGRAATMAAVNAWPGASLGAPSLFPPSDVLTLLLVHVSGCGAIQLPGLLSLKENRILSLWPNVCQATLAVRFPSDTLHGRWAKRVWVGEVWAGPNKWSPGDVWAKVSCCDCGDFSDFFCSFTLSSLVFHVHRCKVSHAGIQHTHTRAHTVKVSGSPWNKSGWPKKC